MVPQKSRICEIDFGAVARQTTLVVHHLQKHLIIIDTNITVLMFKIMS